MTFLGYLGDSKIFEYEKYYVECKQLKSHLSSLYDLTQKHSLESN